jgi:hypothetical protein
METFQIAMIITDVEATASVMLLLQCDSRQWELVAGKLEATWLGLWQPPHLHT